MPDPTKQDSRQTRRQTSFVMPEADYVMMRQLANEGQLGGKSRHPTMQGYLEEALALYRPVLEEEYRRVLGREPPNPASDD